MFSWKNFIAWRFFRSNQNNQLTNLVNKISVITNISLISILILTFAMLRGFQKNFINNIIETYGDFIIQDKNDLLFDPKETLNLLTFFDDLKSEPEDPIFLFFFYKNSYKQLKICKDNQYKSSDIKNITVSKGLHNLVKGEFLKVLEINFTNDNLFKEHNFNIEKVIQSDLGFSLFLNEKQYLEIIKVKNTALIKCKKTKHISESDLDKKINIIKKTLPNMKIITWREMTNKTTSLFKNDIKIFYIIFVGLMILCSLVNMMAITMFIYSKKQSIRILKSLKANQKDVIRIFTRYNMFLALIGIFFGVTFGLILCKYINEIFNIVERIIKVKECFVVKNGDQIIHIDILYSDVLTIVLTNFFSMIFSAIIMSKKISSIEF